MRTPEELERVAFKEPLTPEEDDRLTDYLFQRSLDEPAPQRKKAALKQAAFFAVRANDKGVKEPAA